MRPNQHKNRQRNRGRRQGSSTNRTYESNGPDVKVRGTAQHVAEKYLQLGRDALASGDTVMSESYFQHAEHYLRIVAANQPPHQQTHMPSFNQDDDQDGDEDDVQEARVESRTPPPGSGPQPELNERDERPRRQTTNGGRRDTEDEADGWAGPQPSFLQKPVATAETEEAKPRRAARTPRGRRPRQADGEAPADSAETGDEPVSGADAANVSAAGS